MMHTCGAGRADASVRTALAAPAQESAVSALSHTVRRPSPGYGRVR
jgi:hypothetical protein